MPTFTMIDLGYTFIYFKYKLSDESSVVHNRLSKITCMMRIVNRIYNSNKTYIIGTHAIIQFTQHLIM